MYVKRFTGRTTSEALTLARRELGEETLLLGVRRRKGEGAEVTVAVERPRPQDRTQARIAAIEPPRPSRLFAASPSGGGAVSAGGPPGGSASEAAQAFAHGAQGHSGGGVERQAANHMSQRGEFAGRARTSRSVSIEEMFAAARIDMERSPRAEFLPAVQSPFHVPPRAQAPESSSLFTGFGSENGAGRTEIDTSEPGSTPAEAVLEDASLTAISAAHTLETPGSGRKASGSSNPSAQLAEDAVGSSDRSLRLVESGSTWAEGPGEIDDEAPFSANATGRGYEEPPVEARSTPVATSSVEGIPSLSTEPESPVHSVFASTPGATALMDAARTGSASSAHSGAAQESPSPESVPALAPSRERDLPSGAPAFALSVRARSRAVPQQTRGGASTRRKRAGRPAPGTEKTDTNRESGRSMSMVDQAGGASVRGAAARMHTVSHREGRSATSTLTTEPAHSQADSRTGFDFVADQGGLGTNGAPADRESRIAASPVRDTDEALLDHSHMDIHAGFDLISKRIQKLVEEVRGRRGRSGEESCVTLPSFEEVTARLAATGLEPGLCEAAARAVRTLGTEGRVVERAPFLSALRGSLAGMLAPVPLSKEKTGPRILALIGPSGTGKTTTAVKLAAREALSRRSRTVLVGADHRRIGALEPLRECSELIDAPLEIVTDSAELSAVLARRADADFIVIDTAGLPPFDSQRLFGLERLLEAAPSAERLLVLAATTRARDIEQAVRRFSAHHPLQLVFTKMDETSAHGELLGEAASCGRPVTWFGTGPSIPDDLEEATPERFAEIVVGAAWPA